MSLVHTDGDGLPVFFAGGGVDVFFAEEAHFVGVDEGIDVGRVAAEAAVVEPDRAGVLLAAVHSFDFALALDGFGNAGGGDGEGDDEEGKHEDNGDEDVAVFGGLSVSGSGSVSAHQFAERGRVWVLLKLRSVT